MTDDVTPKNLEILDYTPEQWERYKWQVEREAHERELILKEKEDRRSFLKSPLILSIVGAIIAFLVNVGNDAWTKSRNLEQMAREAESGLIQKAMDQDDPAKSIARLRLLDAAGMIPQHRNQLMVLWTDEKAAQLFLNAHGGERTVAPTTPTQSCDKAHANGQMGWLYLGRADKTAWVPAERGSDMIRYETPQDGKGFLEKLKGQCLSVVQVKFLRDDGPPGHKLHAPIKMAVSPAMRLRLTDLDRGDPSSKDAFPAIWGHVEVLAD